MKKSNQNFLNPSRANGNIKRKTNSQNISIQDIASESDDDIEILDFHSSEDSIHNNSLHAPTNLNPNSSTSSLSNHKDDEVSNRSNLFSHNNLNQAFRQSTPLNFHERSRSSYQPQRFPVLHNQAFQNDVFRKPNSRSIPDSSHAVSSAPTNTFTIHTKNPVKKKTPNYRKVFNWTGDEESTKRIERIASQVLLVPGYTPHINCINGSIDDSDRDRSFSSNSTRTAHTHWKNDAAYTIALTQKGSSKQQKASPLNTTNSGLPKSQITPSKSSTTQSSNHELEAANLKQKFFNKLVDMQEIGHKVQMKCDQIQDQLPLLFQKLEKVKETGLIIENAENFIQEREVQLKAMIQRLDSLEKQQKEKELQLTSTSERLESLENQQKEREAQLQSISERLVNLEKEHKESETRLNTRYTLLHALEIKLNTQYQLLDAIEEKQKQKEIRLRKKEQINTDLEKKQDEREHSLKLSVEKLAGMHALLKEKEQALMFEASKVAKKLSGMEIKEQFVQSKDRKLKDLEELQNNKEEMLVLRGKALNDVSENLNTWEKRLHYKQHQLKQTGGIPPNTQTEELLSNLRGKEQQIDNEISKLSNDENTVVQNEQSLPNLRVQRQLANDEISKLTNNGNTVKPNEELLPNNKENNQLANSEVGNTSHHEHTSEPTAPKQIEKESTQEQPNISPEESQQLFPSSHHVENESSKEQINDLTKDTQESPPAAQTDDQAPKPTKRFRRLKLPDVSSIKRARDSAFQESPKQSHDEFADNNKRQKMRNNDDGKVERSAKDGKKGDLEDVIIVGDDSLYVNRQDTPKENSPKTTLEKYNSDELDSILFESAVEDLDDETTPKKITFRVNSAKFSKDSTHSNSQSREFGSDFEIDGTPKGNTSYKKPSPSPFSISIIASDSQSGDIAGKTSFQSPSRVSSPLRNGQDKAAQLDPAKKEPSSVNAVGRAPKTNNELNRDLEVAKKTNRSSLPSVTLASNAPSLTSKSSLTPAAPVPPVNTTIQKDKQSSMFSTQTAVPSGLENQAHHKIHEAKTHNKPSSSDSKYSISSEEHPAPKMLFLPEALKKVSISIPFYIRAPYQPSKRFRSSKSDKSSASARSKRATHQVSRSPTVLPFTNSPGNNSLEFNMDMALKNVANTPKSFSTFMDQVQFKVSYKTSAESVNVNRLDKGKVEMPNTLRNSNASFDISTNDSTSRNIKSDPKIHVFSLSRSKSKRMSSDLSHKRHEGIATLASVSEPDIIIIDSNDEYEQVGFNLSGANSKKPKG